LQREKVVPLARGRVLEIGIGTGRNVRFYDRSQVGKIWAIDPEIHWLAARRIARAGLELEAVRLSAETIPLDDQSFDSVLVTYTLCTIPDPLRALREMRRVLKPEGQLLFCEHGIAPDAGVRRWQKRINPAWSRIFGGCQLNRDVPDLIRESGFGISKLDTMYLPGPRFATYNYWGCACVAH
jgi:ubiquinone/menaquinone biosynthesis C-methylase UbiE